MSVNPRKDLFGSTDSFDELVASGAFDPVLSSKTQKTEDEAQDVSPKLRQFLEDVRAKKVASMKQTKIQIKPKVQTVNDIIYHQSPGSKSVKPIENLSDIRNLRLDYHSKLRALNLTKPKHNMQKCKILYPNFADGINDCIFRFMGIV